VDFRINVSRDCTSAGTGSPSPSRSYELLREQQQGGNPDPHIPELLVPESADELITTPGPFARSAGTDADRKLGAELMVSYCKL